MEEADKRDAHARAAVIGGEMMDITEEIKMLERKLELLKQIKELEEKIPYQSIPPATYPWPGVYPSWELPTWKPYRTWTGAAE